LAVVILLGNPAVEQGHGFVVDQLGSQWRHLKGRIAGGDALHQTAAVRMPRLDTPHGIRRLPGSRFLDRVPDGGRQGKLPQLPCM